MKMDPIRPIANHRQPQGLQLTQIWIPDVRSPAFVAEAHCQSLAVATAPHAAEDQAFIDAVSNWDAA
jgi:Protein  of unknown function (DUF3018)